MERLETSTKIVGLILNRQGISSWFPTSKFPINFASDEVLEVMGIIQDYHEQRKIPDRTRTQKSTQPHPPSLKQKVCDLPTRKMFDMSLRQFERKFKYYLNISLSSTLLK